MKARVCLALLLVSLFTFPAQAATPTPLRDLAPPQRAARVLPVIGGGVTMAFGIWHLFIPYQYGWLPHLEEPSGELERGVMATNFFMGTSLALLGAWSIVIPTRFGDHDELNAAYLWTMTGLWTARVVYQVVSPQGRMIAGLPVIMGAIFAATDLLFLIPALIRTIDGKRARAATPRAPPRDVLGLVPFGPPPPVPAAVVEGR